MLLQHLGIKVYSKLQRINSTSKSLQTCGTNLLNSLLNFTKGVMNKCDDVEKDANLLTQSRKYRETRIVEQENYSLDEQL